MHTHLSAVSKNIEHIRKLHGEAIYADRAKRPRILQAREQYAADTQAMFNTILADLQVLELAANDEAIAKCDRAMRGGRFIALAREFSAQINAFRKMEDEQAVRNHDRLVRLYLVICPEASDDDAQRAASRGDVGQELAERIEQQTGQINDAQKLLQDAVDRQNDIASITYAAGELTRLHNQVLEMIGRQQARLDIITVWHEKVEATNSQNTQQAAGAKRRRLWLIVATLILLIIVTTVGTVLGVLASQGRL
ncbi:hypothetical protein LPJ63_000317 [Coemansia sp. RSA 2711]|nr:hypothetical protein LPJ63_000317 [Coemansia sp. RSA 2711]